MTEQHPQHWDTVRLVLTAKRLEKKLAYHRHEEATIKSLLAWIDNELRRRVVAACRGQGITVPPLEGLDQLRW